MKMLVSMSLLLIGGLVCLYQMSALDDFDLSGRQQTDLTFHSGINRLTGSFFDAGARTPIVLLVHGDGAQTRDAAGGLAPMINSFLDAGISVFSWDKPGTSNSTGNWLHQSMTDRASEVLAARDRLAQIVDIENRTIGLLGLSQAGWVLSKLAASSMFDFQIFVGAAVSWQRQGAYFAEVRMRQAGYNQTQIDQELERQAKENLELFATNATYERYLANVREKARPPLLSRDRHSFIATNQHEDMEHDLSIFASPLLVLSGSEDLNADARETVNFFKNKLIASCLDHKVRLVPEASHGLLNADYYNFQQDWPISAQFRYLWQGRTAYAEDSLSYMVDWILKREKIPSQACRLRG